MTNEKMTLFKCFSGSVIHASKDGKETLCGLVIESNWREVKARAWKMCKKCAQQYPLIMTKGRQITFGYGSKEN